MVSQTRAELQEEYLKPSATMSGDTVLVTSLDQRGFVIEEDTLIDYGPYGNETHIAFVDSTIKGITPLNTNYEASHVDIEGFHMNQRGFATGGGIYVRPSFHYDYRCGTELPDPLELYLTFFQDSTHVVTYEFELNGVQEVISTIHNC